MTKYSLTTELEAALVRELQSRFEWENRARFANRLQMPVFALSDTAARLGRWCPATRTIELSRAFAMDRPWLEVTGVLEHEMAHQYVDEVLGVRDETSHGDTFRRVCAQRGIDGRAASVVPLAESAAAAHAFDRIRKLLALAGSSNRHEAELAMRKAHELMLRHNVESASGRDELGYAVRHLSGDPTKRATRVEADIVGILIQFFFVKAIRVPVYLPRIGKRGAVYEIVGTPSNLDMAGHVYAFLMSTAERLWQQNRGDSRVRNGRDRIAYQSGVVRGFRDTLAVERTGLQRGTGLIWVGDSNLEGFYRRRHPRISTRRSTIRLTGAHEAGREAGRAVVLHKPVTPERSGAEGTPRLLPATR